MLGVKAFSRLALSWGRSDLCGAQAVRARVTCLQTQAAAWLSAHPARQNTHPLKANGPPVRPTGASGHVQPVPAREQFICERQRHDAAWAGAVATGAARVVPRQRQALARRPRESSRAKPRGLPMCAQLAPWWPSACTSGWWTASLPRCPRCQRWWTSGTCPWTGRSSTQQCRRLPVTLCRGTTSRRRFRGNLCVPARVGGRVAEIEHSCPAVCRFWTPAPGNSRRSSGQPMPSKQFSFSCTPPSASTSATA